jgi:hypothetical protein
MQSRSLEILAALGGVVVAIGLTPFVVTAAEAPLPAVEQPLKPEHNPPGDIPDDQVFITYASPLGFTIKIPQGWARADRADGAVFNDKYDRVALTEASMAAQPDLAMAKATLVPELKQTARAVTIAKVKSVTLPAGPAILVSYGSNSDPNPVTNKAIRLENDRYYFWQAGKLVTLDMSAPAGADNVDQWNLMARSFKWQ